MENWIFLLKKQWSQIAIFENVCILIIFDNYFAFKLQIEELLKYFIYLPDYPLNLGLAGYPAFFDVRYPAGRLIVYIQIKFVLKNLSTCKK